MELSDQGAVDGSIGIDSMWKRKLSKLLCCCKQTPQNLWMDGPTALRKTGGYGTDLDFGAGCWMYVDNKHWASSPIEGVRGDGRLHLFQFPSGHWAVASSEAYESNLHGEGHYNGEYPHITSDFQGESPCGYYQGRGVRFAYHLQQ